MDKSDREKTVFTKFVWKGSGYIGTARVQSRFIGNRTCQFWLRFELEDGLPVFQELEETERTTWIADTSLEKEIRKEKDLMDDEF
ncbi:MAG: hypothetical protein K8T10_20470 [Candidatus Eremiobacteraeota bacterium]|nr:hypothetical protein [Candidatus Eremiobacteraeota bacterium]